jgi:hypothetical protein
MTLKPKKTGFLTALLSIMAGAIGVQKRANMERDLEATNPATYVIAALLFLAIFIGSVALTVSLVIP